MKYLTLFEVCLFVLKINCPHKFQISPGPFWSFASSVQPPFTYNISFESLKCGPLCCNSWFGSIRCVPVLDRRLKHAIWYGNTLIRQACRIFWRVSPNIPIYGRQRHPRTLTSGRFPAEDVRVTSRLGNTHAYLLTSATLSFSIVTCEWVSHTRDSGE